ncbi:MAG: glycosyltransferase family 2 protein [Candidatus Omnitrophota bacterium]
MSKVFISVVVPAYNEEKNLPLLFDKLKRTLEDLGRSFEIIFVNDASEDSTEQVLTEIQQANEGVILINLSKRSGKAVALERGFELVRGDCVVIIDADLQHDPADIPKLIQKINEGYDVVSGKRMNRDDPRGKLVTSRLFNMLMRLITGLNIDDYFSGLKCFRLNVIRFLALYGDLYRFAAVFAFKEGFKVAEIPVTHYSRAHGKSTYSKVARFRLAVRDLIAVMFSITLSRKRVYVLGVLGLLFLSAGLTLVFVTCYQHGFKDPFQYFYGFLGLCLLFLGAQALIIKRVADDFYVKHYDEFKHRQRNVRSVLK